MDPEFEHALLLDRGTIAVGGVHIEPGDLACQSTGPGTVHLNNTGVDGARVLLLGASPSLKNL